MTSELTELWKEAQESVPTDVHEVAGQILSKAQLKLSDVLKGSGWEVELQIWADEFAINGRTVLAYYLSHPERDVALHCLYYRSEMDVDRRADYLAEDFRKHVSDS